MRIRLTPMVVATNTDCDKIFVIYDGYVVAEGHYVELVADGLYQGAVAQASGVTERIGVGAEKCGFERVPITRPAAASC